MLWENAQDHGSFRHSSSYMYASVRLSVEADNALIARVQESLRSISTENIRRFAAVSLIPFSFTTFQLRHCRAHSLSHLVCTRAQYGAMFTIA